MSQRSRRRVSRLELVAVVLLLALSLGLRLTGLHSFIANDEIRWTCRSVQFREALRQKDWAGTFRVGHPGVVTSWLGAVFIPRSEPEAESICRASKGGMELGEVGATPEERTRRIAVLGQLLFQGRIGVPLFTWLCILVIFLLARANWGPEVGVLSLSLIALDPFYLALSRVLHIDAVLTSLMTVSVLSLLASLRPLRSSKERSGLLVLSGTAGGLAMLQKSPAVFLAPFAALLLIADAWRKGFTRQICRRRGRDLFLWALVVVVVYIALWPAMWSDPQGTIQRVLGEAIGYAEEGHVQGNYFLGQPVRDPGWGLYPVALLFRTSPLALVGLVAAVFWLARGRESGKLRFDVAALLLYSVLFGVFMSLGSKKFDRYLLPVFPSMEVAAAVGFLKVTEVGSTILKSRLGLSARRSAYLIAALIVVVIHVTLALPHYPHYLTYYNPLLGGLRQARNALVVGWGEGYEEAAAYLNAKPNARELQVAVPTFSAFAPLFSGETQPISDYSVSQTDYVVFYLAQVQRQHDPSLMERYFSNPQVQPEYTVVLHGVEYAWIYPNTHYVQPMSYIEEHSHPSQDLLLVNRDSVFSKNYQGGLEVREFDRHSSPQEVAGLLDRLPSGCRRVWYPRYSGADPDAVVRLLENSALVEEQKVFPGVKVGLYRLLEDNASTPLDLRFGGLRLRGYGLTDPAPAWGRDGGVILEWESDQALERDYTAFVHLYDSHGHRLSQGDSLIVDQDLRPTSEWEAGSSGTTLHHLSIPPGTPPGRYEVEVGVYVLETGGRLPVLGAEGTSQDTSARLEIAVDRSSQVPALDALTIPRPLHQEITPQLELLGYDLGQEAVLAGDRLPLRLFWEAVDSIDQDYRLQLILHDEEGVVYERREFSLVSTEYPTSQWRPGELLLGWYDLPVGDNVPSGDMTVALSLLDEKGDPVLSQPTVLTELWIQSAEPSFELPTDIGEPCRFNLGNRASLLGYDVESGVHPGERLEVTLYWQARQEMETSYKVFVHLYDAQGEILAQQDRVPGLGARPTTTWEMGEVLADRYTLKIGSTAPAGQYQLAVGLYDPQTEERLAVFGPDGQRLEQDYALLRSVEVEN